jgi:hypothetical protein
MSTRISDIPDGGAGEATDKILVARDSVVNRTLQFPAFQTAKISNTIPNNPIYAQYIAQIVGLPFTGSATADASITTEGQNAYSVPTGQSRRVICAPYDVFPAPGYSVTIGSKTYTFVNSLTGDGQVQIQNYAGNTWSALYFAINCYYGTGNTGWYWCEEPNPDVIAIQGQAEEINSEEQDYRYSMTFAAAQPGPGAEIEVPMSVSDGTYIYFEWPETRQECYIVYDPAYNANPGEYLRIGGSDQYLFVETVVNPGDVLIGATGDDTMVNLARAIVNSGGTPGTDYLPLEFGAHPIYELGEPFDPQTGYLYLIAKVGTGTSGSSFQIDSSSYYLIWHQYQNGGIIQGPYGNYGYSVNRGFDAGAAPPGGWTGGGPPFTITFTNSQTQASETYTFTQRINGINQIMAGDSWYQAFNFLKEALGATGDGDLGDVNNYYWISAPSALSLVYSYGNPDMTFAVKVAGAAGNNWVVTVDELPDNGGPYMTVEAFDGGGAQTTLTFSDGERSEEYRFVAGTPIVDGDISVGNIGTDIPSLGLYLHYCISNVGQWGGNGSLYKASRLCPLLSTNTGSYSTAKVSGLADIPGIVGNSYTVTPNDANIEVLRQFSGGAAGTEGYPGQNVVITTSPYYRVYFLGSDGVWRYFSLQTDQTIWPVPNPTQ